jgi:hypothetical protein
MAMPSYKIKDQNGNVVAVVKGDKPPTPEDVEYIVANNVAKSPFPQPITTPVDELQKSGVQRAIDVGMEYVAGVDRPFASLVDFITTPIRAVEQQVRPYAQAMLGIRDIPDSPQAAFRATEPFSLRGMVAEKGEFAGEGVATDIAAGAGEFTGLIMSMNPAQRLTTQAIAKGLETGTAKNVFELLGSGKPIDDIVFGVTGGFGGEIAAAQADDPNAKEAARIAGQIITPAAASAVVNRVVDYAANNLLKESLPNKEALKGASNYIYEQLKEVQLKKGEAARLSSNIAKFLSEETTTDPMYGTLRNRLGKLTQSIEEGNVDFKTLDTARSALMEQSTAKGEVGRVAKKAAQVLDDAILKLEADAPASIGEGRSTASAIKVARELWRRQSTVGQLQDIFDTTARTIRADGAKAQPFETQLRKEMGKLLNSKEKSLFFTKQEKKIIDDFIDGKPIDNFLEKIGSAAGGAERLSLGSLTGLATATAYATQNPSMVVPSIAIAAGAGTGLLIIEAAKKASLNALKRSGNLMKSSIQLAGADGLTLAKRYMSYTPKDKRKPQELAALLISNNMDMAAFRESAFANSGIGRTTMAYYDLYRRGIEEQSNTTQQPTPQP